MISYYDDIKSIVIYWARSGLGKAFWKFCLKIFEAGSSCGLQSLYLIKFFEGGGCNYYVRGGGDMMWTCILGCVYTLVLRSECNRYFNRWLHPTGRLGSKIALLVQHFTIFMLVWSWRGGLALWKVTMHDQGQRELQNASFSLIYTKVSHISITQ